MLYWGKLSSTEHASSGQKINGFNEMISGIRITNVSIREGLAVFIRDTDRKITVVTLHNQKKKRTLYRRMTLHLQNEQVAFFSTGQEHVVLVSEAGTVYEWKCSAQSNIPRTISSFTNVEVAQVACGNYHSVVLTKGGQLFTWGQNLSGQLGLGKDKPSSVSPQPLKSLCAIPLAQISAGGDHSFALSLSGVVFGWGRNNAGQLGLGDTDDRHVPVCVKSLNLKKTVSVSCGDDHTAVLTKGGLMLTFGSGRYGQLGHNSFKEEHYPRIVAEFWGSKVSQIACGRRHTLALVESSNTIYSFGCGEQGQLGNGQRMNQCVPVLVQLPSEHNSDQMVKKLFAGGNLSGLLISKRDDVRASSNLSLWNGTAVLDDEIIDRWISDCSSKMRKRNKREIKKMFSSASCINGSFCEKCDRHYKTSIGNSGLDLSLARLAFEKLAKKDTVLLEIERTVEKDLLPSLGLTVAGVEALRVYLILPELLRVLNKQGRGTQLTISLATAILTLKPESLEVLTNLWTRLPYYYYRTLVKTFHSACAHFMSLMTTTPCRYWTEVLPVLKVLQQLYSINSQRIEQLTEGCFLIKELNDFFESVNQDSFEGLHLLINLFEEEPGLFTVDGQEDISITFFENAFYFAYYPCVLDIRSKHKLFRFLQLEHGQWLQNTLCVNRGTVLADTLKYLKKNDIFPYHLKVKFALEDGIDDGGLRAEFFTLLGQEITRDSSIVQEYEDSGLLWFSADDSGSSPEEMFYIGVICGLAFNNSSFINIGFPMALFKKMLNLKPTLNDLEELSPVEARSLKNLLMEDEDVVEELYLDFTVKGKELIPNGAEIPVTKANRQKYVDLYVDFVFNKSVENKFKKFKEGIYGDFFNYWKMFSAEELKDLLYGVSEYGWEELQKGVTYTYCEHSDELIQNFWSVFFELNEEQRKKFLTFVFATDRLPLGGLSKLQLKIVRCNYDDADERFPSAQTCYGLFCLPNYSTIDILRNKLVHAITYCEVFGRK